MLGNVFHVYCFSMVLILLIGEICRYICVIGACRCSFLLHASFLHPLILSHSQIHCITSYIIYHWHSWTQQTEHILFSILIDQLLHIYLYHHAHKKIILFTLQHHVWTSCKFSLVYHPDSPTPGKDSSICVCLLHICFFLTLSAPCKCCFSLNYPNYFFAPF